MNFSECYERYIDDIEATALSQYVRGYDYDDVVSEMIGCLWKAWKTYQPHRGSFPAYWWSLWLNRRSDLNEAAGRQKRPVLRYVANDVLLDIVGDRVAEESAFPSPPQGAGMISVKVWTMLAAGYTAREVMEATGISKRGYYGIIRKWRTEEVKGVLTGS